MAITVSSEVDGTKMEVCDDGNIVFTNGDGFVKMSGTTFDKLTRSSHAKLEGYAIEHDIELSK